MRISELDFYEENGFVLEQFTVITSSPQTNPGWLVRSLAERHNGTLVELGVHKPQIPTTPTDFLILTNLELPILSGHATADELVSMVKALRGKVAHLAVSITLNDALIDRFYETGSQLARMATKLLYEAQLVVQLQPLATGRSREITGRFVVARGPRDCTRTLIERELFYHVGMRGNVELFANQ